MPAYCLFCETQKCATIARVIERCWGIPCVFPEIDRGRKRCCVEFTFDDVRRTVWLGYDLIEPTAGNNKEG